MTARAFTAVCFDMDGVLIQSRSVIERAWTSVAQQYGISVDKAFIDEHIHGRPGAYTLDVLFADIDPAQRHHIKQQVDAIEEISECALVPGVAHLIKQLRDHDLPMALVTSSWPARIAHVLRQHHLEAVFDCIISRDDIIHGKPAPDAYVLAARQLHRVPGECLVFEDSVSGVQAAVGSGALCLGIGNEPALADYGAAATFTDFDALTVSEGTHPTCIFEGHRLVLGALG